MSEPGQATDKTNTDTIEAAVQAAAKAYDTPDNGYMMSRGYVDLDDLRTIITAAAPILMQAGRDQAYAEMRTECTSTLMDLAINPDHHGCPCRTTGRHRVHRCDHGTEWWAAVPDSHNTQEDDSDE